MKAEPILPRLTTSTPDLNTWRLSKPSLQGPQPDSNWICPLLLAGAYPGHSRNDDLHQRRLQSLLDSGVRTFVSLLPFHETFALRPYEEDCGSLLSKNGKPSKPRRESSDFKLSSPGAEDDSTFSGATARMVFGRQRRLESLTDISSAVLPTRVLPKVAEGDDDDDEDDCDETSSSCSGEEDHRRSSTAGSDFSVISHVPSACSSSDSGPMTPASLSPCGSIKYKPHALEFVNEPITDRDVTSDHALNHIADLILEKMREGRLVYLHCWAGRGRTGTVAAVVAARYWGIDADTALALVQESYDSREDVKGFISPETPEQFSQVRRVLHSNKRKLPPSSCPSPLTIPPRSRPRIETVDPMTSPRGVSLNHDYLRL